MKRNVLIYCADNSKDISALVDCIKKNGLDARMVANTDELEKGFIKEYSNLVFVPHDTDDALTEILMVCANFRAVIKTCTYCIKEGYIYLGRDNKLLNDDTLKEVFDEAFVDLSKLPKPVYLS